MATIATPIKPFKYEIRPPKPHTKTSPTLMGLLNDRDPKIKKIKVTVPVTTRAYNIAHEPIYLNQRKFEPGKSYTLHPIIAKELQKSIENFEEKIVLQVTKGQGSKANVQMLELDADGSMPAGNVIASLSE